MLNKFQEIELVLVRANEHLEWLRKYVVHPNPDLVPEKDGWIVEEPMDIFGGNVRIRIGDFAATLRNALNYLACLFAEQDSGSVGKRVQFPIEDSPKSFAGQRPVYLKGVADPHVAAIERFQPYNTGDWIKDIQTFSNWYRHSGLIK